MTGAAAPAVAAQDLAAALSPSRRRLALAVVALAFVLDLLDSTIVNLAVPSIRAGLGVDDAMVQWAVAGYALSFSMFLIVGGRLGDLFGYRRMFLIGVALFALTSAACGLAATPLQLVGGRLLQGAAAAMMAPQVMSLVQLLYAPHERGGVMGLFGALGGFGASLGPVLGGVLIRADLFGLAWRPIFLINLPVAALALCAGAAVLPAGRSPRALRPDLPGALLAMTATFLLIYPLIEGRQLGWPIWIWLVAAAGVAAALGFARHLVQRDRRDGSALAPIALFRTPGFSLGLLSNLCLQTALGGYFLTFSLTLQLGVGLDVMRAALTTLPFAVGVGSGVGLISQRYAVRLGRRLILLGLGVLASGWALLAWMIHDLHGAPPAALSAPVLLAAGLGMGMAIGPLSGLTLAAVDRGHAGAASGVVSAVQQLGSALGGAALGSLYFAFGGDRPGQGDYRTAFPLTLAAGVVALGVAAVFVRRLPSRIGGEPMAVH